MDIRERLAKIIEGQRGAGPDGTFDDSPYILTGFVLSRADLDELRPHFDAPYDGYPKLGEEGRYYSVPVFEQSAAPKSSMASAEYLGIQYSFVRMDSVD